MKALIAAACAAVVFGIAYFVWMDRSDRMNSNSVAYRCASDRSFIQTMESIGNTKDATVVAARRKVAECDARGY